jgi:hypothetical protein
MEVKGEKGEKPAGASIEGYMIGGPTIEQGWGKPLLQHEARG